MGSVCTFLPGALTSCGDGIQNGNEEGVDCGGPNCGACSDTILRVSADTVRVSVNRGTSRFVNCTKYKGCPLDVA